MINVIFVIGNVLAGVILHFVIVCVGICVFISGDVIVDGER